MAYDMSAMGMPMQSLGAPTQATPVNLGKKNIGSTFSGLAPAQQQVQNQALSQLMALFQTGTSPFLQQQKQLAQRNFQTNTVPSLAERFTSLGSGSQRSSAFQSALSQGGNQLEQMDQQGALQLLLSLLGPALQDTNVFQKKAPSFWESLGGGVGQGVGNAIGNLPLLLTLL